MSSSNLTSMASAGEYETIMLVLDLAERVSNAAQAAQDSQGAKRASWADFDALSRRAAGMDQAKRALDAADQALSACAALQARENGAFERFEQAFAALVPYAEAYGIAPRGASQGAVSVAEKAAASEPACNAAFVAPELSAEPACQNAQTETEPAAAHEEKAEKAKCKKSKKKGKKKKDREDALEQQSDEKAKIVKPLAANPVDPAPEMPEVHAAARQEPEKSDQVAEPVDSPKVKRARKGNAVRNACLALVVVMLATGALFAASWFGLVRLIPPVQDRVNMLPDPHARAELITLENREFPSGEYQVEFNENPSMQVGSVACPIEFEVLGSESMGARFDLVLNETGEYLASSRMVKSGNSIREVNLSRTLDPGQHKARILVNVYRGTARMNALPYDVTINVK